MAQKPFGRILMEARERQGLDIDDVSRQLRVRADILRAIEHNDFGHIPARGYARNMIGSYARLLGLNAAAVTNQYLKEANDYQVQLRGGIGEAASSRTSSRSGSRSGQRSDSRRASRSEGPGRDDYGRGGSRQGARGSQDGRSSRSAYDRRTRNGASEGYDGRTRSRSTRESRPADRAPRFADGETIGRNGRRVYDARNSTRLSNHQTSYEDSFVQRSEMGNKGFRSSVDGKGLFNGSRFGRIGLVVGAVVVVLVLIFVVTQVVSCVGSKSTTTNSSVPITGVSDTTNSGENSENTQSNTVTESAPTSCLVQYEVPSGVDVWLEIYENDSATPSTAQIVSGPSAAAYTVTGTWKIVSPSPTAVTVTCDGSPVELTANDSGTYEATVDFAVILNQWVQTHKSSSNANKVTSTSA